jgi:hypothetical protein
VTDLRNSDDSESADDDWIDIDYSKISSANKKAKAGMATPQSVTPVGQWQLMRQA